MKYLFLLLMIATTVNAKEYRLLEVEHFDIQYQEFKNIRDPYVSDIENLKYRVSTNFTLGLHRILYWDNKVHTEALKSGTVKTVGWHWVVGLRVNKYIDVFSEHHSRHVMEEYRATKNGHNMFPVEDSYGVKLTIIDIKNTRTLGNLFD